jgi:hypothetical protein
MCKSDAFPSDMNQDLEITALIPEDSDIEISLKRNFALRDQGGGI